MFTWKTARPEAYGIPAAAVERFEGRLARLRVRIHGYLMLCGRTIVAERYRPPYGPDVNHRMYSVAKSFTAMAVGLLAKEGKITLEDSICAYFPEKLPENGPHPWCAEMTVRDMLSMRSCHSASTYKRYDGDWVESFFRVEPDHIPGTVFSYDTSASHVLAALVEKLTGANMLDYLRVRALERTGFSEGAYMIKDPAGISQGGSGLMCTLRDMAGAAYLCGRRGELDGEELIPRAFMEQALSFQAPTKLQPALDEQNGYGYLFWMPREEGFCMYGMGGQLALCFPRYDFSLLTMADTIGSPAGLQILYDSFYETVYPYVRGERDTGGGETADAGYGSLAPACPAGLEKPVKSGTYRFYENVMGWRSVRLDWENRALRVENQAGPYEFAFGAGEQPARQTFPYTRYPCECTGQWKNGHFLFWCRVTGEEQGHAAMDFAWKGERLGLRMECTGEPFLRGFRGIGSAVRADN